MDANRYFDAMHNAMSAQHPGAQLLLTVKLQDTCGNDACLELKQLPGESTSILCYSTMGRRCLNFQPSSTGWRIIWPVPSAAPCRPTRRQPALPPSGWPVIQPYSSIRRCR